jgi:hypothetical protein
MDLKDATRLIDKLLDEAQAEPDALSDLDRVGQHLDAVARRIRALSEELTDIADNNDVFNDEDTAHWQRQIHQVRLDLAWIENYLVGKN